MPLVSCIMTAFNAAHTVEGAVRSILEQTHGDFEILVVDDGSTDGTPNLLQSLSRQDSRIRLWSLANQGQTRALNVCLEHARGEYVARMDADDVSLPHRFERQVAWLESKPNIVALGTLRMTIDEKGAVLKKQKPKPDVRPDLHAVPPRYVSLVHPSAMIRAQVLRKVGGYRPFFRYAQDVDLWLRLAERGRLAVLPEYLLLYRQTQSAISSEKAVEQQAYAAIALIAAVGRARGAADPIAGFDSLDLVAALNWLQTTGPTRDFELWLFARLVRRLGIRRLPAELIARLQDVCRGHASDLLNPRRLVARQSLRRSLARRQNDTLTVHSMPGDEA